MFFFTFIDEYSKKTLIYFLSTKARVLEKFKIFHQEVEHLSSHKIGTLRIDDMFQDLFPPIVNPLELLDNFLNPTPPNIVEWLREKIAAFLMLLDASWQKEIFSVTYGLKLLELHASC